MVSRPLAERPQRRMWRARGDDVHTRDEPQDESQDYVRWPGSTGRVNDRSAARRVTAANSSSSGNERYLVERRDSFVLPDSFAICALHARDALLCPEDARTRFLARDRSALALLR